MLTVNYKNNYGRYTCYSCNEHTAINISEEHREEGISNFTNCFSCHNSGEEGESEHEDDKATTCEVEGVVLSNHPRSHDWMKRNIKFIESLDDKTVQAIQLRLKALLCI